MNYKDLLLLLDKVSALSISGEKFAFENEFTALYNSQPHPAWGDLHVSVTEIVSDTVGTEATFWMNAIPDQESGAYLKEKGSVYSWHFSSEKGSMGLTWMKFDSPKTWDLVHDYGPVDTSKNPFVLPIVGIRKRASIVGMGEYKRVFTGEKVLVILDELKNKAFYSCDGNVQTKGEIRFDSKKYKLSQEMIPLGDAMLQKDNGFNFDRIIDVLGFAAFQTLLTLVFGIATFSNMCKKVALKTCQANETGEEKQQYLETCMKELFFFEHFFLVGVCVYLFFIFFAFLARDCL